jgi:hypothetical protein
MNNITATVSLLVTLTAGAGAGALAEHTLTANAVVTCSTPPRANAVANEAQRRFFQSGTTLPTTGGVKY